MNSAGGEAVPLSEHEQRLLEQIERALYAEDPKFASTVRGGRLRKPTRRRRLQGVALFVVGLVLLVVGVAVPQLWLGSFPVLSVVGFLMMLGGAVLAVTSVGSNGQAAPEKNAEPDKNRFTGRMEERFRRRFEQE
jgi:protein-S-isoprenylcysteine O-methyltransferase Ste14